MAKGLGTYTSFAFARQNRGVNKKGFKPGFKALEKWSDRADLNHRSRIIGVVDARRFSKREYFVCAVGIGKDAFCKVLKVIRVLRRSVV